MRRGEFFWGAALILFGGLLLMKEMGIRLPGAGSPTEYFWPLVLIFLGIWIVAGIFLAPKRYGEYVSLDLQGARQAALHMDCGAGRLTVKSGAEAGKLLTGTFGSGLEHASYLKGDTLETHLKMPSMFFPFGWKPNLDWDITLTRDIPLSLIIDTGASQGELDLTELRVTHLDLDTGASSTRILLPAQAGNSLVEIEAGAASLDLCVPQGVVARIHIKDGITAFDIDRKRFPRLGDFYQSGDYAAAANRVDINIEAVVGRISIQ